MKRFLIIIIVIFIALFNSTIVVGASIQNPVSPAKSPTPSPNNISPTDSEIEKIQKIKDMVASKVAELKLVEKKGLLGKVVETSTNQITISDLENNNRIIDVDELTKFVSNDPNARSFGISDLKEGNLISAVGLYNKETKRLLARFVYLTKKPPVQFSGTITDKDKVNYTLTVENKSKEIKTIDIETSTKTTIYQKNYGLLKSGFSKTGVEDEVLVTGYYDLKDKNVLIADRIMVISDLISKPSPSSNPSPSQTILSPTLKSNQWR